MRDPAEGPLGLPFERRGNVNGLEHIYDTVNLGLTAKERNLFLSIAPSRRTLQKKLHKVFHKFLLRCFAP